MVWPTMDWPIMFQLTKGRSCAREHRSSQPAESQCVAGKAVSTGLLFSLIQLNASPLVVMKSILFNLDLTHWPAVLLSLLPALLNLFIFIYVRIKFPTDKISRVFSFYLVALIVYQFSDTFTRLSSNVETATLWSCIFMVGILFMVPLGLHFALLFVGKKKFTSSLAGQIFLYLPVPVFLIYVLLNKDVLNFFDSPFWGWTAKGGGTSFLLFEGYWLGTQGLLIFFFLMRHAFKASHKSVGKKQSLIIALGYMIPTIQGFVTQVILPGTKDGESIPLASTCATFFSVAILIAMKKYGLFSITDSLQTETILETMTDVVIIASPDKEILFINKEGEQVLGVNNANNEYRPMQSLFADEKQYEDFIENLFKYFIVTSSSKQ